MNLPKVSLTLFCGLTSLSILFAHADTLTLPNTFRNGQVADPNALNANLDVIVGESNENDLRINTLEDSLYSVDDLSNIAVGTAAVPRDYSGRANTVLGIDAMQTVTASTGNTALGASAMRFFIGSPTLGDNTAVGYNSLVALLGGSKNTAVGSNTLFSLSSGGDNTAIGYRALFGGPDDALQNVAVGSESLFNGGGNFSTAVGYRALYESSTGSSNTAIGLDSMRSNIDGSNNVTLGARTMELGATGDRNTVVGMSALRYSTGSDNVAVGYSSMSQADLVSGDQNTVVGALATVSSALGGTTNSTAIGYGARAGADNTIALGNLQIERVITSGQLTTGDVTYPNTSATSGFVLTMGLNGVTYWQDPALMASAREKDLTEQVAVLNRTLDVQRQELDDVRAELRQQREELLAFIGQQQELIAQLQAASGDSGDLVAAR